MNGIGGKSRSSGLSGTQIQRNQWATMHSWKFIHLHIADADMYQVSGFMDQTSRKLAKSAESWSIGKRSGKQKLRGQVVRLTVSSSAHRVPPRMRMSSRRQNVVAFSEWLVWLIDFFVLTVRQSSNVWRHVRIVSSSMEMFYFRTWRSNF